MTGDSRSDRELIHGLPRQPELMGVLYERHAPAVFRYLARRAGPPAAEDLLSEVFIAALLRPRGLWRTTAAARCRGCTGSR